jgi:hypothetical protein
MAKAFGILLVVWLTLNTAIVLAFVRGRLSAADVMLLAVMLGMFAVVSLKVFLNV